MFTSLLFKARTWPTACRRRLAYWFTGAKDGLAFSAMLGLPIRQFPKLSNTTITVTTLYPGASPGLLQSFIATPLEQAIATAEGVDYLTSNSVQGTSTIIAAAQAKWSNPHQNEGNSFQLRNTIKSGNSGLPYTPGVPICRIKYMPIQ